MVKGGIMSKIKKSTRTWKKKIGQINVLLIVVAMSILFLSCSKETAKDISNDHNNEIKEEDLNVDENIEEPSQSTPEEFVKKGVLFEIEGNGTFLYYGDYPQQVLLEEEITSELRTASYDSNNMTTIDGVIYSYIKCKETTDTYKKGETVYFRHEPILWRVLYQEDDKLLLMSEYILDAMPYHTKDESVTWETCTLRSWLNGYEGSVNLANNSYTNPGASFMSKAFNSSELEMILKIQLENSSFLTENIYNSTEDSIFLLSEQDVINTDYGFDNTQDVTITREAYATEYAASRGASIHTEKETFIQRTPGTCSWWIRTGGMNGSTACNIDPAILFVNSVIIDGYGIRPAMYIKSSVLAGVQ